MPRVSVLLPTHNRRDMLELSLRSFLTQSFADFEVLIAGDGCTDGTAEMIESLGDERLRWFDFPKAPGFGYENRNAALRKATGEFIAYASDDDLVTNDHLALMVPLLTNPGLQWVYVRPMYVRHDGVLLPAFMNLQQPVARQHFMTQSNLIPSGAVMHRHTCLDEVGGWPEGWDKGGGDWDLWKRIITHYGPPAISLQRQPSHFHFLADWRAGSTRWPGALSYLSAMADYSTQWAPPLRLRQEPGQALQATLWQDMSADPNGFKARLRHATAMLQDRLAWQASLGTDFL